MNKSVWISILCLAGGLFKVMSLPLPQFNLYHLAESYILSSPAESSVPVAKIIQNYKELQVKWLGSEQAKINESVIRTNPLFAKTLLTDTTSNKSALSAKITFLRLKYTTPSPYGIQHVSGLLIVPPGAARGVVLFFHSTITGKLNVPSLKFTEYKAQMQAAIFAANGYIVVSPDYIGLGDNYKVTHPYILYPGMNVEDGKNMLLATRQYLIKHNLHYPGLLNLFVSGYSEGGSYALWFSRIYQQTPAFAAQLTRSGFTLQKTAPIDGAYNLTGVMFPFLLTNQVRETKNLFNINTYPLQKSG